MKILQLIQKKQLRGAEIFACQLSVHLQATGHQVRVLALEDGDGALPFKEIEVLNASPGELLDWKTWRALADDIHGWQPNIVQANAGDTLRYAASSKKLFSWKSKLIFRNANLISGFIKSGPKHFIYRKLLNSTAGIASVSEVCRKDIISLFNLPEDKVRYLPIGIDLPFQKPYASWTESGIPFSNEPVFLHCGAMVTEKNHLGLLRIFQNILKTIPTCKLLLIGTGPLRSRIKSEIHEMNLNENVVITENRADIHKIMPLCKALLLPSLIEGLPGVILESFASNTPVLAYSVGGIPEVITSEKTGWLIEPGDETGFAKKIIEILQNPTLAESVKKPAFDLVSTHFNNRLVAGRFVDFYKRILEEQCPPGIQNLVHS